MSPTPHTPERPTVPEATVKQLTECTKQGASRLTDTHYAILFDINVTEGDDIGMVKVKDSMIGDSEIEACMVRALEGMSLPSSIKAMRSSRHVSTGRAAPESRALVGNSLPLVGPAVGLVPVAIFIVGVTVVVGVTIYVVRKATTATRDATDDDREKERCKKAKQECIEYCSDTTLPTPDFGWKFQKCKNDCLERHGCPRDS